VRPSASEKQKEPKEAIREPLRKSLETTPNGARAGEAGVARSDKAAVARSAAAGPVGLGLRCRNALVVIYERSQQSVDWDG
jgi:hypothetical protein